MSDSLLYLISPPNINDIDAFASELRGVIDVAGEYLGAFQLRLKEQGTADDNRLTDIASSEEAIRHASDVLLPICKEASVPFILNDNAGLALSIGADGVHLGQEDGSVRDARLLMGEETVIGVSCHASRHLAMEAGDSGADYVAFGAFYPTNSKSKEALEHWGTPDISIIEWWTTHVVLPCVAIGGITPHNALPLIEAGADFVAALSSVWFHEQGAQEAIREFVDVML